MGLVCIMGSVGEGQMGVTWREGTEVTQRNNLFLSSLMAPAWSRKFQSTQNQWVRTHIVIIHPLFSCELLDHDLSEIFWDIFMDKWKVFLTDISLINDFRDIESWKEHCWKLVTFCEPSRKLMSQEKEATGKLESDRHTQGEVRTQRYSGQTQTEEIISSNKDETRKF